jgi:glycosyltransferase involved in cell wall biosynthesis
LRILFVIPYPPSRLRVRPYHLLLGLLNRGHQLTLATLHTGAAERADIQHLEALGVRVVAAPMPPARSLWNCLRALPTNEPLQASFCWSPALACALRQEVMLGHDLAHVEHLRGARYAHVLKGRLPVVWDAVDSISLLFEQAARHSRTARARWLTRFELPRTRALERAMLGRVDRVLVSSPIDRAALVALLPSQTLTERVFVLPNGVDTDYYQAPEEPPEPQLLIFTGRLRYHANLAAALQLIEAIMPRLWQTHPGARLVIAGHNPGPALRSAAARDRRIELRGSVPDLRPDLQRASVAVAPTVYGAGIQNKVLEAMSMGRPVVASRAATAALQARAGSDFLLADSAAAFARAIARLLDDPALRTSVGQNGRCYVERHHQWSQVAARLEQLYSDASPSLGTA